MKAYFILTVLLFLSVANASNDTLPKRTFLYSLDNKTLEVTKENLSYEAAYEQAAIECFNFFKGTKIVSEDRGLDIIDVCANPK